MLGLRFVPKVLNKKRLAEKNVAVKRKTLRFSLFGIVASGLIIGLFSWSGIGHAQGNFQITGTVTNPSNNGVQNVSVYATNPGGSTVDYGPTTTASDGTYTLGVDAGTYDLHFVPPSGSGYYPVVESNVTITTDQTIDVQFVPSSTTYTYSGTLTDQNGNPVPNSSITIASSATNLSYNGSTDSNGNFSITVTPGTYDIVIAGGGATSANPDYANWSIRSSNNDINLTTSNVSGQTLQIDMVPLTVTVNDANGNPLANIPVTGSQGDISSTSQLTAGSTNTTTDGNSFSGTTGANGSYTVLLPEGSFFTSSGIKATLSNQTITAGVTVNGPTTVTLTAAATYTYSGTLTDQNGNPVPNSSITIASSATNLSYNGSTDSNGNFSITVTPGTYDIVIAGGGATSANPDYANWSIRSSNNDINLTTSNVSGQTLQIDMVPLTVTVNDANGNPLANIPVTGSQGDISSTSQLTAGSTNTTTDGNSFSGTTGANGSYTVLLPEGSFFTSSGIKATLSNQTITAGVTVNGPTTVTLTAAATYTYSGTLTDQNGNPVPNSSITIASSATNLSYNGSTDSNGNFSITVTPGTYDIVIAGGGATSANPDYANWSIRSSNNDINLTTSNVSGQTLQIDMVPLTVTVNDANGNPLANIPVTGSQGDISSTSQLTAGSTNTTTDGNSFSGTTGANGSYTVLLPEGSFFTSSGIKATLSNQTITAGVTVNGPTTLVLQQISPVPSAPTNLTAPTPTNSYPSLSWDAVSGVASYNIYRDGVDIGNTTNTTYTDSSLATNGTQDGTYTYSVTAVNSSGGSPQSSPVSVVYDTTPPVVTITGVTAGETYPSNNIPTPVCNTTDALSGVATNASLSIFVSGNSYTASCSGATDNAGNLASPVSVTYTVLPSNYILVNFTNSNGNPIDNAKVTIENSASQITTLYTDAFGNAYLNTTPGNYKVTVYYANGYESEEVAVTANGPNNISFSTVNVTVTINDPSSSDIANASVAQAGNTGDFGSKVPVNSNGQVNFNVLPGTSYFTAYDANGFEQQSLTVSPTNNTVTFNTYTVQVTVTKNGNPLTTATVQQAGDSGSYGSKLAVNSQGQITVNVMAGTDTANETNYFIAWDGSNYTKDTLVVTGDTSTTIAVN